MTGFAMNGGFVCGVITALIAAHQLALVTRSVDQVPDATKPGDHSCLNARIGSARKTRTAGNMAALPPAAARIARALAYEIGSANAS